MGELDDLINTKLHPSSLKERALHFKLIANSTMQEIDRVQELFDKESKESDDYRKYWMEATKERDDLKQQLRAILTLMIPLAH